ncbi:unnamed protein product [Nyctereutes procyonoides]|uniref:(raccoon dog) hypothetical protein n=1 Tax=Nyctereutes procyonoides TaxID=34880 RepID=A0A811Z7V0_NYCPR|nr:unnamed protein product [Nyctereutes procyonoides]
MAAISSSSWLAATHDHDQCHLVEHPGEAIPHHWSLPTANLSHWWASFFFGKSTLPVMATESSEHSEFPQASSGTVTCDLVLEALRKQPG